MNEKPKPNTPAAKPAALLYGYIAGLLMEARESQGETVKIDLAGVQENDADT